MRVGHGRVAAGEQGERRRLAQKRHESAPGSSGVLRRCAALRLIRRPNSPAGPRTRSGTVDTTTCHEIKEGGILACQHNAKWRARARSRAIGRAVIQSVAARFCEYKSEE